MPRVDEHSAVKDAREGWPRPNAPLDLQQRKPVVDVDHSRARSDDGILAEAAQKSDGVRSEVESEKLRTVARSAELPANDQVAPRRRGSNPGRNDCMPGKDREVAAKIKCRRLTVVVGTERLARELRRESAIPAILATDGISIGP